VKRIGILCIALALTLALVIPSAAFAVPPVYITGVNPVPPITVDWLVPYEDVIDALPETTTITCSDDIDRTVNLTWVSITDSEHTDFTYHPMSSSYLGYVATATFDLPAGVVQSDPPTPLEVTTRVRQMTSLLPGIYPGVTPLTLSFPGFDEPGTYVQDTMEIAGGDRTYYYYVPTSYDGSEPVPLLVVLHGGGSCGMAELLRADGKAEECGFIVVCPDYSTDILIPYVSGIIDELSATYNINARRVYAAGISMGGGSTAALVLALPDKIAAAGLVSGGASVLLDVPLPRPMTIVMTGGSKERVILPIDRKQVPGMLATANWLVGLYGCDPDPDETVWDDPGVDPRTSITRYAWSGGVYGTEVVVYAIWNGGHCWPGGLQYAVPSEIGWVSQHIDALDQMWPYLAKQRMPIEADIDIKPGSYSNPIALKGKGVIPVAILTTEDFDATEVDTETVRFGPDLARPVRCSLEDVNYDGDIDMVLHFRTQETGIQSGDTSVTLTGVSFVDWAFFGSDDIVTVP
jgi:poly(3-hydroxybutyrate) depolymerase